MGKKSVQTPRVQISLVELEKFKAAFKPKPIPLAGFNVIIGRNGSGKSTLIEALQCLDTTIRRDANAAFSRYDGIHDVINVRTKPQKRPRSFSAGIDWSLDAKTGSADRKFSYRVELAESSDGSPLVLSESLDRARGGGESIEHLIRTTKEGDKKSPGIREIHPEDRTRSRVSDERERLSLGRIGRDAGDDPETRALAGFWERAVFLRLSPNRLGGGSVSRLSSFEPLLDEEGKTLPNLLNRLSRSQRAELVDQVRAILPDIKGVHVDKPTNKRDEHISYALYEKHPTGRGGDGRYLIPAALLSEGTRRLTALAALLVHDPAPSLLCIEEIENGLDPNTTLKVLEMLKVAARAGTQVIITTHSPWLLDSVDWADVLRVTRRSGDTVYSRFRDEASAKKYIGAGLPPGVAYVNQQ